MPVQEIRERRAAELGTEADWATPLQELEQGLMAGTREGLRLSSCAAAQLSDILCGASRGQTSMFDAQQVGQLRQVLDRCQKLAVNGMKWVAQNHRAACYGPTASGSEPSASGWEA